MTITAGHTTKSGTVFCESPSDRWNTGAVRDLLEILDRAHTYLDDHPDRYPPRTCRPTLSGRPL